MLRRLSIAQYVIISSLSVDFDTGLTVLTGETGAGKSILLDALGLLLGDEAEREAIRQGEREATIEGVFAPPAQHPVWIFLAENKGQPVNGPDLTIRRVIDRGGKDDITVNGAPVALDFLKKLGAFLVEIHGQFANQTFLAPENQLALLDAFGAFPPIFLQNVARAWDEIGRIEKELQEERDFVIAAGREKADMERTVSEVAKLGLREGLYEEIKAEHARLVEAREICELFRSMNAQLIAQTGIELSLARIDRLLAKQPDPALAPLKAAIGGALEQTRTAISEMQALGPAYLDIDTGGIRDLEQKITAIADAAATFKVKPEELFTRFDYMSQRLTRLRDAPVKIKGFDDMLIKANESYRQHATALSNERKKAARLLSDQITAEMPPLKLLSAQVEIEVGESPNQRTPRGFNEVSYTARMNPGQPFSPIAKTASGGELSRLILAVKMILQQVQVVSTLVFDEIDTGIGGAAAAAVGGRIARLAEKTQVLVITHSPQVASRGDQHLHVSKKTEGETTRTIVRMLTLDERIHEVSRMLAGEEVTIESSSAARTLIMEAQAVATARRGPPS